MSDFITVAELRIEAERLCDENERLEAENAKLRERVDAAHMSRLLTENENEWLRKLADAVKEFVEDTHCEDCPCRRDCEDNNRIFCVNDFSYHAFAAMRELGVEVDG